MSPPHQPLLFPASSRLTVCRACGQRCFDLSNLNASPPSSSRSGTSNASSCDTEKHHSHLDLLELVFATCDQTPSPNIAQARELAQTLSLGHAGAYTGYVWDVDTLSLADVRSDKLTLPEKHKHSGDFNWIGSEKPAYPQYLWDSINFQTVEATPERLRKYCAVSWTWGRFQLRDSDGFPRWRKSPTVRWRVPVLPKVDSPYFTRPVDRLTHLKHLLRKITAFRYFWLDVLCINQGADPKAKAEKKAEIAKQAQIFQNASASIAYLWTLEERTKHDLSRTLGAFGSLLASCVHFRPGQPFYGATPAYTPQTSTQLQDDSWRDRSRLFTHLQDDKLFSSLWGLQEMVLFPSAMWMTEDGCIVKVNGHIITTRLFATAIRLLREMAQLRRQQWKVEEKQYMLHRKISPSRFFMLRKELSDLEHKRKVALQEGSAAEQDLLIEMSYAPRTPSVLKHHLADQPLQDEIDQWVDWSSGRAGIEISLGASRTAILTAGSNREVVDDQSKEYALLAALKIGNHKILIPETLLEAQERHFSHNLLNVILQQEGPQLFDVIHESFAPEFKTLSSNMLDTSDWDMIDLVVPYIYVEVPKQSPHSDNVRRNSDEEFAQEWTSVTQRYEHLQNEVKYHQHGHDKYVTIPRQKELLLTDMLPWKARYPNYTSLSREACTKVIAEDVRDWHIHPSGKVHIPHTARIQDILERHNSTEIKVRFNGGEVEYGIWRSSDLKLILTTQKWLSDKLGQPRFLLVPLYTCCCSRKHGLSQQSKEAIGKTHSMKTEETFGILLVGKGNLRKDQSLTTWYKLGTYTGKGPFTTLGWKDGILITSPYEEARTQRGDLLQDCERLRADSAHVTQTLLDAAPPVEKDWDIISPAELMDLEQVRSREALVPD